MKDVLYLYSRLNGFVLAVAEEIAARLEGGKVHIVHWDKAKDTGNKFVWKNSPQIEIIGRSEISRNELIEIIMKLRPSIVYLSGWMDKDYIAAVKAARRKGATFTTVCGLDDQWFGTIRQNLGRIYFLLFYRRIYDFMWVAGKPQYHYARMMGYPHNRIVGNLLSADVDKFKEVASHRKRFVFLGRFEKIKGLDTLIAAHESLSPEERAQWPLVLIGDGELRGMVESKQSECVHFIPYLQPPDLARELSRGGIGMMTSTFEAWSVGLHELAWMGFPLIASRQCGAASEFLVHGYNGFLFEGGDVSALAAAMRVMIASSDDRRAEMGRASMALARRINPRISAQSLLSLLVTPPIP